jgi:hypothetical protein
MNSECFLMRSFNLFSSKNSTLSDFICNIILVPLVSSASSASSTVKVPPAEDYHLWTLSSLDLESTSTLSATKYEE